MLNEHDHDVLPRCPRLGHELTFGYCRQETRGACKKARTSNRSHQQSKTGRQGLPHLPEEDMTQVERAGAGPPPSKVLSLVEMIQQAKDRIALKKPDTGRRGTQE